MIQPITKNNVAFKGSNPENVFNKFTQKTTNNIPQETKDDVQLAQENNQEQVQKATVSEKFNNAKIGVLNGVKKVNTFAKTSNGIIHGVVSGVAATAVVGVIGKNVRESHGHISGTIGGIIKDCARVIKKAALFVPSLITKSPLENVKNLAKTPVKFYTDYLNILGKKTIINVENIAQKAKTHKSIAAIATVAGLGALAFKTIQGKVKANLSNADLDHKVNQGHVK